MIFFGSPQVSIDLPRQGFLTSVEVWTQPAFALSQVSTTQSFSPAASGSDFMGMVAAETGRAKPSRKSPAMTNRRMVIFMGE